MLCLTLPSYKPIYKLSINQTCGNGCYCGNAPAVPSPFPTRQPTANNFVVNNGGTPTMLPVTTTTRVNPATKKPTSVLARTPVQPPTTTPILPPASRTSQGGMPLSTSSPTPGRPTNNPTATATTPAPSQWPTVPPAGVAESASSGSSSATKGGMDAGTTAGVVVACVIIVGLILAMFVCKKSDNKLSPADVLKAMYATKMAHEGPRPSAQFEMNQVYAPHLGQHRPSAAGPGPTPFVPYTAGGPVGGQGQRLSMAPRASHVQRHSVVPQAPGPRHPPAPRSVASSL
jgi:hypothetical protein